MENEEKGSGKKPGFTKIFLHKNLGKYDNPITGVGSRYIFTLVMVIQIFKYCKSETNSTNDDYFME